MKGAAMIKMKSLFLVLIAAIIYSLSVVPVFAKDDSVKIRHASRLVSEIAAVPKWKIPPGLIKSASAVIIVKRDFMVTGGNAGGFLLVQDKTGAWSNPVFVNVSGGTLGWQVVTDPLDIMFVFKNSKRVDELLKGKLKLNSKVAVQPGWLGLNMKSATPDQAKAEILTYVRSRGSLVEDSTAAGVTMQIDNAANAFFYGKPKVAVDEILSGKVAKQTDDIKALHKLLADYSAAK
jgi:lipid-binding SYLF domain-containing protein